MNKKKELGQFFTTNVDYILNGFEKLVKNKNVVDPYAGNCDLLNWAKTNGAKSIKGFDIDTAHINDIVSLNDSLMDIPKIGNFNITNPPYLAKNKMGKILKNKYLPEDIDDFYLLALKKIINSDCSEGIIIIPINFFSAENSDKIRKEFISIYDIGRINYFTEQVFDDTTYNVVAFHYFKSNSKDRELNINIFPENKTLYFKVEEEFSYRIGGKELYEILSCKINLNIKRLTEDMMISNSGSYAIDGYYNDYKTTKQYFVNNDFYNTIKNNIITLECIDGKNDKNKICAVDMRFGSPKILIGKNTSRNIASIIVNCPVDLQSLLIKEFNKKIFELRNEYYSLFLTNFRDNNRKRISFDFCYKLLNYCYNKIIKQKAQ